MHRNAISQQRMSRWWFSRHELCARKRICVCIHVGQLIHAVRRFVRSFYLAFIVSRFDECGGFISSFLFTKRKYAIRVACILHKLTVFGNLPHASSVLSPSSTYFLSISASHSFTAQSTFNVDGEENKRENEAFLISITHTHTLKMKNVAVVWLCAMGQCADMPANGNKWMAKRKIAKIYKLSKLFFVFSFLMNCIDYTQFGWRAFFVRFVLPCILSIR